MSILETARPLHVYLHIAGIFSFIGKKPKEHGKTIITHFYWLIIFQYRKLKISADKKNQKEEKHPELIKGERGSFIGWI